MTEEKKAIAAAPVEPLRQGIPAIVDSTQEPPIVLSQAPAISPSAAKPVVDKASTIIAAPPDKKK